MIMKRKIVKLEDVFQTGREMARLVVSYFTDLGPWLARPFCEFYRHVCELPYIDDPDEIETISRPAFLLCEDYAPRDCDDKAILCACWWRGHGHKCRFVATSTTTDGELHHVFLQVDNGIFVDSTYKENADLLGNYDYFPKVTNLVYLTPWF